MGLLLWTASAAVAAAGNAPMIERHVHVAVQISADGKAESCRVVDSDAPEPLQAETCRILREKARFTPKLDANGYAVSSVYETTVRYQVPVAAAPVAPPAPVAADPMSGALSQDPLESPFTIGGWSGSCRKGDPVDTRFVECKARFSQGEMSVTMQRTYAGVDVSIDTPACNKTGPAGSAYADRVLVSSSSGPDILRGLIAAAVWSGRRTCAALPERWNVPGDYSQLIAATGNLRRSR